MKTRITIATVFTKGNEKTDGMHTILFVGNSTMKEIVENVKNANLFNTKFVKVCNTVKVDFLIELTSENMNDAFIDVITNSAHKVADFDHVII